MNSFRNILYPTDFSKASGRALEHAVEFARRFGAKLHLLHVRVPYSDDPGGGESDAEGDRNLQERLMDHLRAGGFGGSPELNISTSVTRNISPAAGILDFLAENSFDLAVIGTHGRSALTHFLLGSVAEKVVRHAPCPVLTIGHGRANYKNNPRYERVLAAFDFSEYSRHALIRAWKICEAFEARLLVLYVFEQPVHPAFYELSRHLRSIELPELEAKTREAVIEALGEGPAARCEVMVRMGESKAYRDIRRVIEEQEVDLVVMGTHGLSGFDRLLLGSTTERLVRIASCPILTFKMTSPEAGESR